MAAIDVVVAAFAQPRLLRVALESVQRQTFQDFAVLVADDSRSEANRAVVDGLADARFGYQANPETLGPAGNHRRALAAGRAPLVAILNQDDAWKPAFLEILAARLAADPRCVVAFCDHEVWDEQGRNVVAETETLARRYGRDRLAAGLHRPFHDLVRAQTIPIACAALFRREAVPADEPPEEVGGAYDLWLAFRLASSGAGACYVPERLAAWHRHAASLGERRDARGTLDIARTWSRIRAEARDGALGRHAARQASSAFTQGALQLAAAGERGAARDAARRGLAAWPSLRSLARALLATGVPARLLRRMARPRRGPEASP